jgi:hypothetical protein
MVIAVIESALESAIGGAIVAGGLSAVGAALYSIGIPKDSAIAYEAEVKTDRILVMAHGSPEEVERARAVLKEFNPSRLDLHEGAKAAAAADADGALKTSYFPISTRSAWPRQSSCGSLLTTSVIGSPASSVASRRCSV